MTKDKENRDDVAIDDRSESLQLDPRRKYERIMLAAAEATRLNEEVRRKGIKLGSKVTIEALKRVDEGKVKGELRGSISMPPEEEAPADPIPEIPSSTLFAPSTEEVSPEGEEATPPEED